MAALKTETVAVLGIALAVVYLAYQAKDAVTNTASNLWDATKDAAAAAVPLVDPTSDKNLAYTGVNKVGAAVSGNPNFDLGVATYDATHTGALGELHWYNLFTPFGIAGALATNSATDQVKNWWNNL